MKFEPEQYIEKDKTYWEDLESLGLPSQHIAEHFPAFVRRREMARFIVHYELFKKVVDLPGSIVELGIFKGSALFTWAKLMETFCPGDRTRFVYGFDWFQGLQDFQEQDGKKTEFADKIDGGYKSDEALMDKLVEMSNQDNFLPGVPRVKLVKGDVRETVPAFVEEFPGIRISLLYLDLDLYEPTKVALENLYDRVVPGGIIVFDEYGLTAWEGESRAVEEFFQERGIPTPVIKKFPISQSPHGYIVKG